MDAAQASSHHQQDRADSSSEPALSTPIWEAEMYGYAFAAAKADVWHHHYPALQAYPPAPPDGEHAESDLPPHHCCATQCAHTLHTTQLCHSALVAIAVPHVLHYPWELNVGNWSWAKGGDNAKFDVDACPPWPLTSDKPMSGIFPPPPHPDIVAGNKTVRGACTPAGRCLCWQPCLQAP
jgi:hypothetical protein